MPVAYSSIEKTVHESLDIMADVSCSFSIWKELTDANNRSLYEDSKDRFEDFFFSIDRANLAMVINGLHMLLEDKSNTHNLQSVLKQQRSLGKLYEARVDAWLSEIATWESSVKKIIRLRSNVYAHRGGKATAAEFMNQAAVTPDEIESLVIKLEGILKSFAELALPNTAILPFSRSSKESTRELMAVLRSPRN